MRDQLKTDLGKYVYDYSDLPKSDLPDSIAEDIADAYCVRHEIEFVCWIDSADGHYMMMGLTDRDPTMYDYAQWRYSFEQHGYSAPLLNLSKKEEL